ncbi:MAG: ribosome recycling factor [Parcubacteria group bacterium]|nr:ribosome recycling factor [Parcubacteria group bacterium]
MDYIKQFEVWLKKSLEEFTHEVRSIKAGQASPALVEDVRVSCYDGQVMQLKQIAAISVSSSRELLVQPWDKTLITNITKALADLPGGIQATPNKNVVRLTLPMLTEDRRKEFIKLVHNSVETTRIRMRKERDEINKKIDTIAAEDERFRTKERIDEVMKSAQKDIDEVAAQKEKELLSF